MPGVKDFDQNEMMAMAGKLDEQTLDPKPVQDQADLAAGAAAHQADSDSDLSIVPFRRDRILHHNKFDFDFEFDEESTPRRLSDDWDDFELMPDSVHTLGQRARRRWPFQC